MSVNGKELVKSFFEANFHKDPSKLAEYLHPEVIISWNSSFGFYKLDHEQFVKVFEEMGKSFQDLICETSHLLQDDNTVTIRFSYRAIPIEDPEEEILLAHFIAIWELKDDKLYRGYFISQPEDDGPESFASFIPKND